MAGRRTLGNTLVHGVVPLTGDLGVHALQRLWTTLRLDRPVPAVVDRAVRWLATWWLPALLLFGLALFLPYLDARPLRFEEGRRAVQALEILAGGSWWHLEVLGEPYINKPPLLPWLMVLASYLTGDLDEWAVRLPTVLAALLGAVSAAGMARLLVLERGRLAALAGGVAFFSCAFVSTKARLGETDMLVTAFCGVAVLIWVWASLRGKQSWVTWFGVWFFLAAAAFAKGPIPIVFPALALIAVPLLRGHWREALIAGLVVAGSMLPLAYWAYINWVSVDDGKWAIELRVAGSGFPDDYWQRLLRLNEVPTAIIYTFPWIVPALLLIRSEWQQLTTKAWPVLALALYAIPFSLFVLLWGEARPRYAMPGAWPVAALAGGWAALHWHKGWMAGFLLVGSIVYVSIFQLVVIGSVEGGTDSQRAFRAKVEALAAAVRPLGDGPIYLYLVDSKPDEDALAYAGRPLQLIADGRDFCPEAGRYLLTDHAGPGALADDRNWRLQAAIAEDWMHLYQREEESCPLGGQGVPGAQ